MIETNTQDQGTQDQGTPATQLASGATDTNGDGVPAKLYATKEEALAAKPADAPKSLKPMEVSKGGAVVGWVLCRGYDHGLSICAKLDGYSVSTGVKATSVTKEAAKAKVMEMSDDEWKALIAARRAAAKGK